MLNFDLLEKGLGLVSLPHFEYDFSRKMFPIWCFINSPDFIFWLPLLFEILCNMCIVIVSYPACDAINLNWAFSSSRFLIWPKILEQNFMYFQSEKSF